MINNNATSSPMMNNQPLFHTVNQDNKNILGSNNNESDEQINENPTNSNSIRAFKIKSIGNHVSIVLIYLNCSCNFLIYCFCNKKFKNSLKVLIKKSIIHKFYQRAYYYLSTHCCFLYKKRNNIIRYNSHPDRNDILNHLFHGNDANANNHNQKNLLKKIDEDTNEQLNFIDHNNDTPNNTINEDPKVVDFKIDNVYDQTSMEEPRKSIKFMERFNCKPNFVNEG
jgi:hypothetical protein